MLPKKQIGDIGEQACITRLLMLGYTVLRPIGDYHRFDIVYIDNKEKFIKAQIKVGWQEHLSIVFNSSIRDMCGGYEDIDVFLVYFNGRIFKMPAKILKGKHGFLYLGKRKTTTRTKYSADKYELLPKEQRWLDSIKQD